MSTLMFKIVLLLCFFSSSFCFSHEEFDTLPVAYQGRIRPASSYAQLWLHHIHHTHDIPDPLDFLWQLNLKGHDPFDDFPLFWIRHSELKELFQETHISYNQ